MCPASKCEGAIMKLRITGLAFSPRNRGNSEIAVKELVNLIPEPYQPELKFYNMSRHRVLPCTACYRCLFSDAPCHLGDEAEEIIKEMADADALVIAVPSYFMGPNALFKNFIDRFLLMYRYTDQLTKKPVVLISIYGVPETGEGYVDLALRATAYLLNFDVRGHCEINAALPGEVVLSDDGMAELKRMAEALVADTKKENKPNTCGICGGEYFRFMPDGAVSCMICKGRGRMADGSPVITPPDGTFFGSETELMNHKKWLMGMKEKFFADKGRYISVMTRYK